LDTNLTVTQNRKESKYKLVLEALRGERTRAEIAREHDVSKSLLWKWEQAFLEAI